MGAGVWWGEANPGGAPGPEHPFLTGKPDSHISHLGCCKGLWPSCPRYCHSQFVFYSVTRTSVNIYIKSCQVAISDSSQECQCNSSPNPLTRSAGLTSSSCLPFHSRPTAVLQPSNHPSASQVNGTLSCLRLHSPPLSLRHSSLPLSLLDNPLVFLTTTYTLVAPESFLNAP